MSQPFTLTPPPNRLPLRGELFVLAHTEAGEPMAHRPSLSIGLAGAILIGLVMPVERVRVIGGSAAVVVDRQMTGDPVTDWAVTMLAGQQASISVPDALRLLAVDAYQRTSAGLIAGGLVTETNRRRLLVRTVAYPPSDSAIIPRVRGRLRYVLQGVEAADPQTDVLAGLIRALGLESTLYLDAGGEDVRPVMRRMLNRAATEYPGVKEIVKVVEGLIGESAISVYG
ncbi:GOLPH3/VPS74 family protein [Micromonospora sp. NPDC003197]